MCVLVLTETRDVMGKIQNKGKGQSASRQMLALNMKGYDS